MAILAKVNSKIWRGHRWETMGGHRLDCNVEKNNLEEEFVFCANAEKAVWVCPAQVFPGDRFVKFK